MDCAAQGMFVFAAELSPLCPAKGKFKISPIRRDFRRGKRPAKKAHCGTKE